MWASRGPANWIQALTIVQGPLMDPTHTNPSTHGLGCKDPLTIRLCLRRAQPRRRFYGIVKRQGYLAQQSRSGRSCKAMRACSNGWHTWKSVGYVSCLVFQSLLKILKSYVSVWHTFARLIVSYNWFGSYCHCSLIKIDGRFWDLTSNPRGDTGYMSHALSAHTDHTFYVSVYGSTTS